MAQFLVVRHLQTRMTDSPPSKRSSFLSLLWVPIGLIVFFVLLPSFTWWPPVWLERHTQRQKVDERVQSVGGWDAIRRGCVNLAEQHSDGFSSQWHETNGLPAAIVALKPLMVKYDPAYGCVRIRIFGIHATGGHSTPYFGLEVDTSAKGLERKHGTGYDNGGVIGNYHSTYNQVAEGIYEIY